ncbi:MAG: zf-TFIIB domain-containing protein [Planctomycetota bacterium]|jgi:Zn-finger nucleic acid-binding protein
MLCPACGEVEMLVLEFELVEVDYCPECGGVWLDSGELGLIGRRAGVLQGDLLAALEQGAGRPPAEGKRRCPVCGKALKEVATDTEPEIVLDRCPRRDGLWFDGGELPAVIEAAGAPEGNVLARFFAELTSPDDEGENP